MDIGKILFEDFMWNIHALIGAAATYAILFFFHIRKFDRKTAIIASVVYPFISIFSFGFLTYFFAYLIYKGAIGVTADNHYLLSLIQTGFYLALTPLYVYGLSKILQVRRIVAYILYSLVIFSYLMTCLVLDIWYLRTAAFLAITGLIALVFYKDIFFIKDNRIHRTLFIFLNLSIATTWISILLCWNGRVLLGWDSLDAFSKERGWLAAVVGISYLSELILLKSNFLFFRTTLAKEIAAITDELTGVYNLEGFLVKVQEELDTGFARNGEVAFVYLNLLHFRLFNEQYGRAEGDKLLIRFTEAIRFAFGSEAIIARHSSDRFAVFCRNREIEAKIQMIAERVKNIQREVLLPLKVGIYIADSSLIGRDRDSISDCTDRALETARSLREEPRKMFAYYDEKLKSDNDFKNYIISHFDEAKEKGYIRVFYQPIIDLTTNRLLFLEALVRWDDPEKGLLFPGVFLKALEDNHLTAELDAYVFERICMDVRLVADEGRKLCPIGVNLAPQDFETRNYTGTLETILTRYGLTKQAVYLELDQDVLLEGDASGEERAKLLSDEGFRVTLTGLGDKHSSVAILSDRKFDWIKVSGIYMRNFKNPKNKKILKGILSLGNELGSRMIVEGVEEREQLNFILKNGASGAQGYFYCHPGPLTEVESVLSKMGISLESDE